MADVTALVVEALAALGATAARSRAAASRGSCAQRDEGDWPDGGHLQVITPPDSFYAYRASLGFHPVDALRAWRDGA